MKETVRIHGIERRTKWYKMRKMVISGEIPAEHLMRPEIANLIMSSFDPFVK